jgi:hypothetical protein
VPELWTLGIISTTVKVVTLFFAVCLLLTACSHRAETPELSGDAKLRAQIVGTWHSTNGVIVFGSDGSSSSSFTNGTKAWTYQETWMVEDGSIVGTVTHATFQNTTNHEPVGHTTRYKVIHVDDHRLVYEFEPIDIKGGITISLNR